MSRKSDAYLAWCKEQGYIHPPAQAAAAFEAAYDLAIHDAIDLLQKEAPLSTGMEKQRNNEIIQNKCILFDHALQDMMYPDGQRAVIVRTMRRILEVG